MNFALRHHLYMNASHLQGFRGTDVDRRLQFYSRTWTPSFVQEEMIQLRFKLRPYIRLHFCSFPANP
ncbi:hypothetical protein FI287_08570 [Salmonella enterica subsp. enterica]|nr:hypothetical protein [Salmonella enterica subsp. enterica serovar Newport]ECG6590295.1 hypothetical protein [Salmonella enterica subsp. enterica serovar Newport]